MTDEQKAKWSVEEAQKAASAILDTVSFDTPPDDGWKNVPDPEDE